MGLKFKLVKENNSLYIDFDEAYWAIDNICIYPEGDSTYVHFEVWAYPSRESRKHNNEAMEESTLSFGGASHTIVDSRLYRFFCECPVTRVFPDSVPIDRSAQKDSCYSYFKKTYLDGVINYENVFEEDQN